MELDRLGGRSSGACWGSAVWISLSGTLLLREDGVKDANRSRTLALDLAPGSHAFVRPEMVLDLPSFGRSSVLVGAYWVTTVLGERFIESPRWEGLGGSLSKERSRPDSKEGMSKEREERSLELEFARE